MNYKFKFFANGKQLEPFFADCLYNVTPNEARLWAQGIRIGMSVKYRKPSVDIYKITENGEHYLGRIS